MRKAIRSLIIDILCLSAILWGVWHHAHWSVAGLLTAICARFVVRDFLNDIRADEQLELDRLFARLIGSIAGKVEPQ